AHVGELTTPYCQPHVSHVYHLYVIRTPHRETLRRALEQQGISCGIHYPIPLSLQPALRYLGHTRGDFPMAERAAPKLLSLPMDANIAESQIRAIAEAIATFFQRNGGENG